MKLKGLISFAIFLFFITFLLPINRIIAQSSPDTVHPVREFYKRGKINLGEKKVYAIKNIVIEKDSVLYTNVMTKEFQISAISDIQELQIKTGSKVIGAAGMGLALMFIFTLEPMVDDVPNPDNVALRYTSALLLGGLIGAGIGLAIPVRKTYNFTTRSISSK